MPALRSNYRHPSHRHIVCPSCRIDDGRYASSVMCDSCHDNLAQLLQRPDNPSSRATITRMLGLETMTDEQWEGVVSGRRYPTGSTASLRPPNTDPFPLEMTCDTCSESILESSRYFRDRACQMCWEGMTGGNVPGGRRHGPPLRNHTQCCTLHRRCSNCESWSFTTQEPCSLCDRCPNCCECSYCDDGEHRYSTDDVSGCDACNSCLGHCECDSRRRSQVQFFSSPVRTTGAESQQTTWRSPNVGGFTVNPSRRLVGVEIEVGSVKDFGPVNNVLKAWRCSVVSDGSLSGDNPFEINTQPANGNKLVDLLTDVCGTLRKQSGFANSSCGVHVHVDASDLTWQDIRKLVRVYAKVESGMFGIIDPKRQKSTFCRPCGDLYANGLEKPGLIKSVKEKLLLDIYGRTGGPQVKSSQANKYHDARYNALNLHSWFFRGTVEFRHHHGTTKADKIINWAVTCASVVDAANRMTDREIDALPSGIHGLAAIALTDTQRAWVRRRWNKFNPSSTVDV